MILGNQYLKGLTRRNIARTDEFNMKTNAMRILDQLGITYTYLTYDCDQFEDGLKIADQLHLPYELVYKTLVTEGSNKNNYVFVIPISENLDMKKAARAVDEKSVVMIHVKDIYQVTGYIRGGCTAIGMKKSYRTIVSDTAKKHNKIHVSGGKIGIQIQLTPGDLCLASGATYDDIIVKSIL